MKLQWKERLILEGPPEQRHNCLLTYDKSKSRQEPTTVSSGNADNCQKEDGDLVYPDTMLLLIWDLFNRLVFEVTKYLQFPFDLFRNTAFGIYSQTNNPSCQISPDLILYLPASSEVSGNSLNLNDAGEIITFS